jgi:hypothetical protein
MGWAPYPPGVGQNSLIARPAMRGLPILPAPFSARRQALIQIKLKSIHGKRYDLLPLSLSHCADLVAIHCHAANAVFGWPKFPVKLRMVDKAMIR